MFKIQPTTDRPRIVVPTDWVEAIDQDLAKVREGPAGDFRARHLIEWFDNAARSHINWGTPGDFDRCVEIAGKHIGTRAKGFCANRHHEATGFWPGHAPAERGH